MEKCGSSSISTYELGRQPFGLASPAAWLRADGHDVTVADLACSPLPPTAIEQADLIAFYLPMHTATRLFLRVLDRVTRRESARSPVRVRAVRAAERAACCAAPASTRSSAASSSRRWRPPRAASAAAAPASRSRGSNFWCRTATGLPPLGAYAHLVTIGGTRPVGYTEASRGCKHLCRHCPVVPVYRGVFRVVQPRRRAGGHPRGRWPPAPSTSRSAIPISSTAPATRCAHRGGAPRANGRRSPTTSRSRSSTC